MSAIWINRETKIGLDISLHAEKLENGSRQRASDETVKRARKVRAKREELAEDEDDKLTKEEEDEIRSIKSADRSYGLQRSVDDLVKLGARAKDVKAAVRPAVMKKCMSTSPPSSDVTPQERRTCFRHARHP